MLGNNELVKLSLEEGLKKYSFDANEKPEVKVKEGFKHYFTQELWEQAEAVRKCLNYGGRLSHSDVGKVKLGGLDSNEDLIADI